MKKILLILLAIFIVFEVLADEADRNACQYARKESDIETWASYLKDFPTGMCVKEGEAFFKKIDSKICKQAKQQNTFAAWHDYLQKFPEGKCGFEAKMTLKKQIKISNWSQRSYEEKSYNEAVEYCKNLKEGNHNDWRLPTIDELRTIIKDSPRTEIGGTCKISEKAGKLAYKDRNSECSGSSYCTMGTLVYDCSNHSQFNDKGRFLSSSKLSDFSNEIWIINFSSGEIERCSAKSDFGKVLCGQVRCVR